MPTTISQGFQKLRENLEITGLQEATVSTRQTAVRGVVEARLKVLDSFLTGSYRRSTMIAPLSEADVDIFFVLDSSYYAHGPSGLLDTVKAALKQHYKTPDISRSGQAVTIRFDDFRVDVVPAFNRQGGGFIIADAPGNRWISTDPKSHVTIWTNENKAHAGDLVPVIKMIKGWNKENGDRLRSFHLEVVVLSILRGAKISDYPSAVRFVLDKARNVLRQPVPDPSGYGANVGDYLDTPQKVSEVLNKTQVAYQQAVEAERLAAQGQVRLAYERWRAIFGTYFPAYG